jgi:hypothetical protein
MLSVSVDNTVKCKVMVSGRWGEWLSSKIRDFFSGADVESTLVHIFSRVKI